MATDSLVILGLATFVLLVISIYANKHRQEDHDKKCLTELPPANAGGLAHSAPTTKVVEACAVVTAQNRQG